MNQFDRFAEEYISLRKNMFDKNLNSEFPAMLEMLGNIKGKKLLDLGCGFGDYAKIYSEKGAIVTGVDNSKKEIEYAKKTNGSKAKFVLCDISKKFPFDDSSFDIITSSLVFVHLKELKFPFKECSRILKKEGIIVFALPNPVFFQEKSLIGKCKILGKKMIFGDYFHRRKISRIWAGTVKMEHYHRPLEDYFSAFLSSNFELIDFKEPKAEAKEVTWSTKNPIFLVFKLRKK